MGLVNSGWEGKGGYKEEESPDTFVFPGKSGTTNTFSISLRSSRIKNIILSVLRLRVYVYMCVCCRSQVQAAVMMVWATFVAPFAAGQQAFAETNADKHLRDIVSAAGGHGAVRFFRGPVLSTLRRPPFPARDMVGRVGAGVGVGSGLGWSGLGWRGVGWGGVGWMGVGLWNRVSCLAGCIRRT